MKKSRYRVTGTLAVAALIISGAAVVAPQAFAADPDPTAVAILVKGEALSSVHVDLSPYISGNGVKVVSVVAAGGSVASAQNIVLDPDSRGFTVNMPDWSSEAERQIGMSWLYDYVVEDLNAIRAAATIRVEVPRESSCDTSISAVPQVVSRVVSAVPVILDFIGMCQFDSAQYGVELAAGQNAVVDIAPVTAAGAAMAVVPGSNGLRWSYDPIANAGSGPDWVDFTLTDTVGRKVTDRVMVMVDGATEVYDVFGQGTALATASRIAGVVTIDTLEGLDWVRGANGRTPDATVLVTKPPANGEAKAQNDGSVVYTANAGWYGADSFDYTVNYGGGTVMLRAGKVSVGIEERPSANSNVAVNARSGAPVSANVLNGAVGRGIKVAAVSKPAHGDVAILPSGQLQYTSSANYIGDDQVIATLQDALGQNIAVTVNVNVSSAIGAVDVRTQGLREEPVITAKSAVALGDYQSVTGRNATHGTVTSAGSGLIFVPDPGFVGTASYQVVVEDRFGAKATSTVTINILAKLVGLDVWVTTGQEQAVKLSV